MNIENIKFHLLNTTWKSISIIPFPVMYILSDIMFYPLYYLIKYRRKIVRKNLVESFPEKSTKEIIRIEKDFYRFFVDIIFETCKFATISEKEMRKRIVYENLEDINALFQQGKSISLYMSHYCTWEWVPSMALHLDKNALAASIYHKLRNKTVDRLMYQNRKRFGGLCVEMKETLRWVNEQLKNNNVTLVGYIADQSPSKKYVHYFLDFLNHSTPVFVGAEKITKKYKLEAFYLDIKQVKRGYYEARFVKLHDNPAELPDFELTNLYYAQLEETIRRQPKLYLWSHNRFKYAKTTR